MSPKSLATALVAFSFLTPACVSGAQKPDAAASKAAVPAEDIFSGTVTQFTDESLTVVQKVPGQQPVTREFMRDGKTTIEGKLRNKTRVTVRYKALEGGGFFAVHIIVR